MTTFKLKSAALIDREGTDKEESTDNRLNELELLQEREYERFNRERNEKRGRSALNKLDADDRLWR